ncbi:3-hydroxyacyl-CoA dehydrogenase family protein [Chloroflexota bacterium]
MNIETVGVVGCGQMGSGIAILCAQVGYQTIVSEINTELLIEGMKAIDVYIEKSIHKGVLLKQDEENVHARIKGITEIDDFSGCDLVIEAVTENIAEKRKVFAELDRVCPPETILASNSSCLPITELAMVTKRPEKVIGLHFINPAPVMVLLELVTTILSSEETVRTVKAFGESLGKSVIVVRDEPGYVLNRLMVPFILDAIRLLETGVATREDIDMSLVFGCSHPMGPLRLADFIGLDTLCSAADALYHEYKDRRFAPPLSLKRMVAARHMGRKTGKGFYEYD